MLERLGSLDAEMIAEVAARHGLTLRIGEGARERVPVRAYRRPLSSSSRLGLRRSGAPARRFARRRGRLTLISWARK